MEVTRWRFEFERTPTVVGSCVFGVLGILGYLYATDRIVFLPVAFVAGVVTGLLSSSHTHTGNNGIVVTVVGFLLVMIFSTSRYVSSLAATNDLTLGDQLFFGIALFLAEGALVAAVLLPLGYGGALLVGIIRKRRRPGTEPRDLRNLGR